jgi:cardiolipin synthase
MSESSYVAWALFALHGALQALFVIRATLRPHREPASRLAWVVVIIVAPVAGIVAYVLFGDTNIGSRRIARVREALRRLSPLVGVDGMEEQTGIPDRYVPVFRVGMSISSYPPVTGNRARLMRDSEATIDAMIEDIDAAEDHVHLLFYIWLADKSGLRMVEAIKRAASRGVACRVMV